MLQYEADEDATTKNSRILHIFDLYAKLVTMEGPV